MVALARAFKARNQRTPATFPIWPGYYVEEMGQMPLFRTLGIQFLSPGPQTRRRTERTRTVFSPELEIATADRMIRTDNRLLSIIQSGFVPFGSNAADYVEMRLQRSTSIGHRQFYGPTLIDYLDNLLTWGAMSSTTKEAVLQATLAQNTQINRLWTAVHLIIESPDFVVLR